MLFVCHPKIQCISFVFIFSWELKWPQEKLKTMLMQNFGVTNKEHYGMLWYFLEWSINKWDLLSTRENKNLNKQAGPSVNPSRQKTTIASGIFY